MSSTSQTGDDSSKNVNLTGYLPNAEAPSETVVSSIEKQNRHVSFANGCAGPRQTVLAVSITRFDHLENQGYTEYTIQLYRDGRLWSIQRRYSHFEKLSKDLKQEGSIHNVDTLQLPKKRWFEAKRWFNRFDDEYSFDRQLALQDYLRSLVKNTALLASSKVLRKFLEIEDGADLSAPNYEDSRDRNVLVYEVEEEEEEDNNGYMKGMYVKDYADYHMPGPNKSNYHSDSTRYNSTSTPDLGSATHSGWGDSDESELSSCSEEDGYTAQRATNVSLILAAAANTRELAEAEARRVLAGGNSIRNQTIVASNDNYEDDNDNEVDENDDENDDEDDKTDSVASNDESISVSKLTDITVNIKEDMKEDESQSILDINDSSSINSKSNGNIDTSNEECSMQSNLTAHETQSDNGVNENTNNPIN